MADVTLIDINGTETTVTLTSGNANCSYVVVGTPTSQIIYNKAGATSYDYSRTERGTGLAASGETIGVTSVEASRVGDGISTVLEGADVVLTAPAEGDLLALGAGGTSVVNRPDVTLEMASNTILLGQGALTAPVAATMAQLVTALALNGAITVVDAAPSGTVVVLVRAPFAFTVNSLTTDIDSGTVTLAVKIGSTDITGLASVSVTSTKATTNATAANSVAVGDEVSFAFSGGSSPVNFRATLNYTRTGI